MALNRKRAAVVALSDGKARARTAPVCRLCKEHPEQHDRRARPADQRGVTKHTQEASSDRGPVLLTNPSKDDCGAHPESDSCVFELEDRAMGVGNRAKGIPIDGARPAMEAARPKVFACVARVKPSSALGEELSHRVRLRASFDASGKIERALFETTSQGYGYIDKYHHDLHRRGALPGTVAPREARRARGRHVHVRVRRRRDVTRSACPLARESPSCAPGSGATWQPSEWKTHAHSGRPVL